MCRKIRMSLDNLSLRSYGCTHGSTLEVFITSQDVGDQDARRKRKENAVKFLACAAKAQQYYSSKEYAVRRNAYRNARGVDFRYMPKMLFNDKPTGVNLEGGYEVIREA